MLRHINLGRDIAPDEETEACGVDTTRLSVLMENLRNSKANRSEGHCRLRDLAVPLKTG